MKIYQVPGGYPSFEAVEAVFKEKLPKDYEIVASNAGGSMPMFTAGKKIGEIKIRQNAYNGIVISLTSNDGTLNDNISITDYIPSFIVRFLHGNVLGYLTNLIFPAIYGTSSKIYEVTDNIIMSNFEANELDISLKNSMKSMFKGKAVTEVVKSSVNGTVKE
ncbi:MAG: hypothetical protein LBT29_02960 [Flavobacteriaceae bacterium]|jgi:hypothetical protein|nr:hypothetical protein [Flavobacteriaceae bacterium]